MEFSEKLRKFGILLFVLGIITFFLRPVYIECSSARNLCKIYQIPGTTQKFKYSDVKACASSYTTHTWTETKKGTFFSNDKYIEHEAKVYYPIFEFEDNVKILPSIKKIKTEELQTIVPGEIKSFCNSINAHKDVKFRSNQYTMRLCDYWFALILSGVLMFLASRKI